MAIVTFDGTTPEADRTINFGPLTMNPRNEIKLAVIDALGAPVTGTVVGIVSFMVTPPGADRPQTTSSPVDLSTGERTFTPFFIAIETAVFSVTNLASGNRVVATYDKLDS